MNELDVAAKRRRQPFEIVVIHRDDLVSVGREQDDCGIDHIRESSGTEHLPGGSPRSVVQRPNLHARQSLREPGSARASTPHLAHHASMG